MRFTILITTIGSARLQDIVSTYLADEADDSEILIVVDNPALKQDAAIVSLGDDARVRLHFNERNIGLTKSLNRGVGLARGEFIVRNDDDDVPHPARLSRVRQFLAANPHVDILSSHARGISESGGESWVVGVPSTDAAIKAQLTHRNILVASSVAMRRQAILDVGGYCEVFRYAQDYELYLRLIRGGKIFSCVPEILVDRYYSKSSITVNKRKIQALYSFAGRLIHAAETGGIRDAALPILRYLVIFMVPNSLRKLRRGIGRGC